MLFNYKVTSSPRSSSHLILKQQKSAFTHIFTRGLHRFSLCRFNALPLNLRLIQNLALTSTLKPYGNHGHHLPSEMCDPKNIRCYEFYDGCKHQLPKKACDYYSHAHGKCFAAADVA